MTVKECYEKFGGDYEDTLHRLCADTLVARFLGKFLGDGTYAALEKAIADKNREAAFAAAHTLKGLALNLGITSLFEPVDILTEALRHEWAENASELLVPVTSAYNLAVETIKEWQASQN